MKRRTKWLAWVTLLATTATSVYVDSTLWYLARQSDILNLLAFLSTGLGVWVIYLAEKRWLASIVVIAIWGVGQRWLIGDIVTMLFWSIRGFAP
jgi:hypothetical protein